MLNKGTKELINELVNAIVSHDPGSFGLYLIMQVKENHDLAWAIRTFIEKQPDKEIKEILKALEKELKKSIQSCVSERSLDVVREVKDYLLDRLEEAEIDRYLITPIVDNLEYYILQYIKGLGDSDYLNMIGLNERLKIVEETLKLGSSHIPVIAGRDYLPIGSILDTRTSKERFRVKEIEEIRSRFNDHHAGIVFLSGRPGMGKTTLAKLYANKSGKKNIYFLKYKGSFKETINSLSVKKNTDAWKDVLNYWNSLGTDEKNQILLIIDNFNDDSVEGQAAHYAQELNTDLYNELSNLGIQLLITTRIDMENNTYMVKGVQNPIDLFEAYYKKDLDKNKKSKVEEVVELVHNNTLLLALCAGVVRHGCTLEEVINAIKECNVKSEEVFVEKQADFECEEKRLRYTIYEQVTAILHMDNLLKSEENKYILANMALLPLKGMEKQQFLEFIHSNSAKWINRINELILRAWVIEEGESVCLHPIIREILLKKEIVSWDECRAYCQSLKDKLDLDYPLQKRITYRSYAEEVYKHLGQIHEMILAELFYNLSDIYDQIDEHEKSREMIDNVAGYLDEMEASIKKARIYSGIAYSYNNKINDIRDLAEARNLLDKAETLLEQLKGNCTEWDYYSCLAQINSNRGSNELARYSYKKSEEEKNKCIFRALNYHQQALELRKQMMDIAKYDKEKSMAMRCVATSYTGVATVYFRMKEYEKSVRMHLEALKIREIYEPEKIAINQQRMLGSTLRWYDKENIIDKEILKMELEFYPELLRKNIELANETAFLDNLRSFDGIYKIIFNDERAVDLRKLAERKKKIVSILSQK